MCKVLTAYFKNRLWLTEKKPGEQCRHRENEPHHGEPEGTNDSCALWLFQLSCLLALFLILVIPLSFCFLLQVLFLFMVHRFTSPGTFWVYQTTWLRAFVTSVAGLLIIDKTLLLREEIIGQDGLKCQWNIGIRIVEVSMFVGCELCLLQIEMLSESGK